VEVEFFGCGVWQAFRSCCGIELIIAINNRMSLYDNRTLNVWKLTYRTMDKQHCNHTNHHKLEFQLTSKFQLTSNTELIHYIIHSQAHDTMSKM